MDTQLLNKIIDTDHEACQTVIKQMLIHEADAVKRILKRTPQFVKCFPNLDMPHQKEGNKMEGIAAKFGGSGAKFSNIRQKFGAGATGSAMDNDNGSASTTLPLWKQELLKSKAAAAAAAAKKQTAEEAETANNTDAVAPAPVTEEEVMEEPSVSVEPVTTTTEEEPVVEQEAPATEESHQQDEAPAVEDAVDEDDVQADNSSSPGEEDQTEEAPDVARPTFNPSMSCEAEELDCVQQDDIIRESKSNIDMLKEASKRSFAPSLTAELEEEDCLNQEVRKSVEEMHQPIPEEEDQELVTEGAHDSAAAPPCSSPSPPVETDQQPADNSADAEAEAEVSVAAPATPEVEADEEATTEAAAPQTEASGGKKKRRERKARDSNNLKGKWANKK